MRIKALRVARWLALALVGAALAGCPDDATEETDTAAPDTASPDTAVPDSIGADGEVLDTLDPADTRTLEDSAAAEDTVDTVAPDTQTSVDSDAGDTTSVDTTTEVWVAPRCGDGHVDFGEACDEGDALNSDTLPDRCRTDCQAARCGDGVADTGEACDDGNEGDYDGCTKACAAAAVVPAPAHGDVVISELMVDPDAVPDVHGEWIELFNPTDRELNLAGCVLEDDGTDRVALEGPGGGLFLGPGAFMVLALDGDEAANGGVAVDYVYATMLLDNAVDEVVLRCGEVEVDRVGWTALEWLLVSGLSVSLDPTRFGATANDEPASWCWGVVRFGDGDHGTPGRDNPPCFQLDTTVDHCVLAMPAVTVAYTAFPFEAAVEVAEFGVTDLTDGVDVSPNLLVELGHGPLGSDPAVAVGWVWEAAQPAAGWVGAAPLHVDAYRLDFSLPLAGERAVAARASRDGGATWAACDRLAGAADGYDPALAARVDVLVSPCEVGACATPPAAACAADGIALSTFDPDGRCIPLGPNDFDCAYAPLTVDCGASGQTCEAGACGAPAPGPSAEGDVVLTELLIAPSAVERAVGQWVEVLNATDGALNLQGCVLRALPSASGAAPLTAVIGAPLVLAPGAFAILGAAADSAQNGGAPVDHAWDPAFNLPTGAFTLTLGCGALTLDAVGYGAGTGWPASAGAAVSLSPYRSAATDNDAAASWCAGSATFGSGDRGTPGALNPVCPGDVVPVDSCRFLEPALDAVPAGVQATLTVRVIEPPITTKTTKTDVNAKLIVEVGLGPEGARPGDAGFSWQATAPDTAWVASSAQGFNLGEDRYQLAFTAPAPGRWDALARVTADGGNTWSVCDLDGLVAEGEAATPKQVETAASACWPSPCGDAPGLLCKALASGQSGPETVVLDRHGPARCALGAEGVAACTWIDDVVEDCAPAGAICRDGACDDFPIVPGPGDAAISELMIVPSTGALGEWLEISNPGPLPLELAGCVLRSGPDEAWTWPVPAKYTDGVLPPGAAVVVARSGTASVNGNVSPRAVAPGISLGNLSDWIALECDGFVVDLVAYRLVDDWELPVGRPLSLTGIRFDASANDFATWWCAADTATPNALNPLCPSEDTVLDDCWVVAPDDEASGVAGVALPLEGRLFDLGVTDVRPGPDLAPGTVAQVGWGPLGSDPALGEWSWAPASIDAAFTDPQATGHDAWRGGVVATEPGTYAAAFRFSADAGATWRYCDTDGGSFDPARAVTVSIAAGACVPNPCNSPPASTCSGNNLVASMSPGTCAVHATTGAAMCTYATTQFSCGLYGGCSATAGSCVQAVPGPTASGDLVLSEIMRDSLVTAPDKGEWVELRNTRATVLDLRGCALSDGAGRSVAIAGPVPVTVPASGYFLLATSRTTAENGSLANVSWAWGEAFGLANTAQTLIFTCGGVEIDRVTYGWDWPARTGYAMQLHNGATAAQNDAKAYWCEASNAYGGGNRGTPKAVNKTCAGVPAP